MLKKKIDKEKIKNFLLKNRIFHTVLVLILGYIILAPFLPEINFQIRRLLGIPYKEEIFLIDDDDEQTKRIRREYETNSITGNVLVIPTIGVYIPISEGPDDSALFKGAWRRPNSSTPNQGGNTVITGHRFHYVPPNNKTFYNLNKIEKGSRVFVFWEDKEYVYEVNEIFIVEPHQVEIEDNTTENILTLYTCHPLWTADKRFVVRAELINVRDYRNKD